MSESRNVDALRRRAERALDEGRGRRVIEPILEQILRVARDEDPVRLFAHRHLAELRLEIDPWGAALHLRKVVAASPRDDIAHSLMALAHALLGNYRAAVSSYRRALQEAPRNPWYHHNLGHLLDVALDDPRAALPHLELALEQADPPEHEITASAAHCLARLDRLEEAGELARRAIEEAPQSDDHRALLDWIERGAPHDDAEQPLRAEARVRNGSSHPPGRPVDAVVVSLLERHLRDAGFTADQVESARALWSDYRDEREPRVKKPEIVAAAVHYAIALVHGVDGVTQASIARTYGVAARSVSSRYGDIRSTLALQPGDPRYNLGA